MLSKPSSKKVFLTNGNNSFLFLRRSILLISKIFFAFELLTISSVSLSIASNFVPEIMNKITSTS